MSKQLFMLRVANVFIWTVLVLFIHQGVTYIWPRTPATVSEPVLLDKNSYSEGELITGSFHVVNYLDAVIDFERSLNCVTIYDDIYEGIRNIRLDDVLGVPVQESAQELRTAQITMMPAVGFDGVCYIEITGYYQVQLSPILSRTYPVTFRTADFNVRKD